MWVHYHPSGQRAGQSAWALANNHWPGLESRISVLAMILVSHLPQNLNVALHRFNLEYVTEEAYTVRFCIELALQGMSSSDRGGLNSPYRNLAQ